MRVVAVTLGLLVGWVGFGVCAAQEPVSLSDSELSEISAGVTLELLHGDAVLRIGSISGQEEHGSGFEIGMATGYKGGLLMGAPTNAAVTTISQNTFITLQNNK